MTSSLCLKTVLVLRLAVIVVFFLIDIYNSVHTTEGIERLSKLIRTNLHAIVGDNANSVASPHL